MSDFCYLNGKILLFEKAGINLDDLGVLRGYGAFEALKTVNNKIFLFDEHYERLQKSAKYLGIKLPVTKTEIKEIVYELIKKNKVKNAGIRIVLTGGRSADFMHFNSSLPTFYILISELKPLKRRFYLNGVKLITLEYFRQISELKTTSYLKATKEINSRQKKEDFFEILYVNKGNVLECATSNFFIFKGNKLITAKDGILHGTMRNLVISLAKSEFSVQERVIKIKDLNLATESFITATNKNIVPVVKINDKKIGNGKPGENTKKLMEMLKKIIEKY